MELRKNGKPVCLGDKYHRISGRKDPNKELEKSFQKLLDDCCLSEPILNKYMELITKFSPNTLYAFNTNFFTALSDYGYPHVHQRTKNVDIFSKERLFIPIYRRSNGMRGLIYVNFHDQSIRYYDCIGSGYRGGIRHQKLILKYLKLEYFMRKGKYFCTTHWKFVNLNNVHNGFEFWDSGLFMCLAVYHFAKNASEDATLTFTSTSVGGQEKVKRKIIYQIKNNLIT